MSGVDQIKTHIGIAKRSLGNRKDNERQEGDLLSIC